MMHRISSEGERGEFGFAPSGGGYAMRAVRLAMRPRFRALPRFILRLFAAGGLLLAGYAAGPAKAPTFAFAEGDIVFQSLPHEPLVDAIESCTRSPYSPCGLVRRAGEGWVVVEAIEPVKETPLAEWVARARDKKYAVARLRPEFRDQIPAMIAAARTFRGRPYDIRYEMDDAKIYCSELVFKAFKAATGGAELGRTQRLGELDWQPSRAVIEKIEGGPVPLDRVMITPRAVAEAAQVELVRPLAAD